MSAMNADGPCCAHLRVEHGVESPNGGMTVTAEWWRCKDCGTNFIPEPLHKYLLQQQNAALRAAPNPAKDLATPKVPILAKPTPGVRQDLFSLSEGTVSIQWPASLSAASYEDLSDWLDILKRKIGRSVRAGGNAGEGGE